MSNEIIDFLSKYINLSATEKEILSEQSFYNFHAILSQSFHYDDSQLTSFFTLDSKGKKLQEITQNDEYLLAFSPHMMIAVKK